ncbi:MAG: glycosyltransferase [Clostridia bacterium]|nr:glycosyltransferase [Clostridia bacterium]
MKTDKSPLVSVITLSYNSPDLYGAIDSVLNQDYDNIEYIILDDGTPSFDEKQVEDYIEGKQRGNITRLVVTKSPKRLGIVKETNRGLSASTGEYIFNLAGDDQFADDKVLSDWVVEFKRTGAEIITAYREVYDEDLKEALYPMPTPEEVNAIKTFSPEELFEYVEGYNIVFGCCTARTRKNLQDIGLISEKYKLVEDYVLLLRLLRAGKHIEFFDRVVVKYRSGGVCAINRINREYLRDNDNIFKHEVLPYSTDKKRAKRKYYDWRNGTIWLQHQNRFREEKAAANGNKWKLLVAYVRFGSKHPIRAMRILKLKIQNLFRRTKG